MQAFFELFIVALPAVFLVVDPVGIVPIFLSMTAGDTPDKIHKMAFRACVVAGSLLIFFAAFGGVIFKVFGITLSAFRIAGGILLLMTALDMLRARPSQTRTTPEEAAEGAVKEDVAIVPLALPLLAGPGSIATVMVLVSKGEGLGLVSLIPVLLSILITFVASYFVLRSAPLVQRLLKRSGVAIIQRVMGLILASIAVQFMFDGAKQLFAS